MTLRDYWEILRRSWILVVATTVLGATAALVLSLLSTPLYQATSQLFVSVQTADERDALSGGYYVQQRMRSYVQLVDAPSVLDPVMEELGLEGPPAVSAQSPTETVLLNVTATDTDPALAVQIADATAESLATEIVRLETTDSGAKPVSTEVIRPATQPGAPISPRTELNLALGAMLGLMVGVGIAILRHTLDTSIKSPRELEDAAQSVSLGVVSYDPDAPKHPLVTLRGGPRSEAFRTIRTNLRYVDVDNPPRSVVVTSSVPAEGKTTTACNLAIALAQAGSKVLLVEADLRRPRVADYLGVEGTFGLTDVLIGQMDLADAIFSWNRGLLSFLPAGAIPPNPSELLGSRQMADLLTELTGRYDAVILDAPPLLPVSDAAVLATITDGALLVARYGETHHEQVARSSDALRQVGARVLGVILNFAPRGRRAGGYSYAGGYEGAYSYEESTSGSGRRVLTDDEVVAPDPRA